jgi:hypothetical protein
MLQEQSKDILKKDTYSGNKTFGKTILLNRALVAHICNPGYLGGTYQEDRGSKLAWANGSIRSYLEKHPLHKKGLGDWLKV